MIPVFNSIRWRLQAWHGLLLLAVLVAFGSTAYYLALENRLRRVDQELQRRSAVLLSRPMMHEGPGGRWLPPPGGPPPDFDGGGRPFHPDFDRKRPEGHPLPPFEPRLSVEEQRLFEGTNSESFYYTIMKPDGTVHRQSTNAPANIPYPILPHSPSASLIRTRGDLREYVQSFGFDLCLVIGRNIAVEFIEARRLAGWLIGAGAGVLLLGLAGGWWLTTRAMRPIADISATAVKIAGGDLSQRISTDHTETELDQLAGVLNSTFARLEATFAQQIRFTSDAAHELRTPVTVMLTQTQTALSRERPVAEYRETLEACQRAAVRMRKLIESLLELARLDAGQEPLRRAVFDLSRTASDCVEGIRPLADERHIKINVELNPAECFGDHERIAQVITNLLSNAVHYNSENGSLRISTFSESGFALLTVTDTGIGISPADLPHVFERFYRADKARTRAGGHTGLGLSISKAIIDAHAGEITVKSQPGGGSTFTIRLPKTKPSTPDKLGNS